MSKERRLQEGTVGERMLKILSDGYPHTRQELHTCLDDELGALGNIKIHISILRKTLRPQGEDIVCEWGNKAITYRHIRMIGSAYSGYK